MLGLDDLKPGQLDAIEWQQHRTESILALQVGYGKSVIALTAYARLREVYGPWRMLLVSTVNICKLTWGQELKLWSHLPPLTYANASGRNLDAVMSGADITAINFESLEWYLDLIDEGLAALPQICCIDESSKMKAAKSKRTARFAGLRMITRSGGVKHYRTYPGYVHRFKRRWLLSATPNPESYEDLWAQEAAMSPRRRLGENISSFRKQFSGRDRSGFGFEVIPAHEATIENLLRYVMYLPKEKDFLDLDEVTHSRIVIPWEPEARAQYKEMEDALELVFENTDPNTPMSSLDGEEDTIEIVAPNAGVLLSKLRQLCSGFVYDSEKNPIPSADPDAKLRALDDVLERIGDTQLLVFTQFRSEMASIGERYADAQIGLPDDLSDWSNKRGSQMLVLHTASAGHGLNLQHGTHICLYYSLPYSFEQWFHSWGRLQRRGQTMAVSALRFERPNSVCQDAWKSVQKKGSKLGDFMEHMRARRHGSDS